MNEIWQAQLVKLENAVKKSVLDLFEHTGSHSFKLSLDPPAQILFVVAGDIERLQSLIPKKET